MELLYESKKEKGKGKGKTDNRIASNKNQYQCNFLNRYSLTALSDDQANMKFVVRTE